MRTTGRPWGRYFITEECDGCAACVARAPENVVLAWDGSHCVVAYQPANAREAADLQSAETACPRACLRRGSDRATRRASAAGRQP